MGRGAKTGEGRVNKETKRIYELTERLIKIEKSLPDAFSSIDPAEIHGCLQLAREPIELLRDLRSQLAKMESLPVFNIKVKRKLIEISKGKTTSIDRIERHLRVVHSLAAESDEYLQSIDSNLPKVVKRLRQDSQLKTELSEFFGPLYIPDCADHLENIYDRIFGVGSDAPEAFKWGVSNAAHRSAFKPEEYLDWAWKVMGVVNPEQYGKRSQLIGTPVVSQSVPSALNQHLQRLKTCYLLGLDEMAIVFCRSVLEAALFKALHSRGKLPGVGKIDHIKPYEFARLLGLTDRQMLSPEKKARARSIGDLAGSILHTGEPSEATEKVEEIIKDTFDIVEELYG